MPSKKAIARYIMALWIAGLILAAGYVTLSGRWGALDSQTAVLLGTLAPTASALVGTLAAERVGYRPQISQRVSLLLLVFILSAVVMTIVETLGLR